MTLCISYGIYVGVVTPPPTNPVNNMDRMVYQLCWVIVLPFPPSFSANSLCVLCACGQPDQNRYVFCNHILHNLKKVLAVTQLFVLAWEPVQVSTCVTQTPIKWVKHGSILFTWLLPKYKSLFCVLRTYLHYFRLIVQIKIKEMFAPFKDFLTHKKTCVMFVFYIHTTYIYP